jgi:hypothetical protein
MNRPLIIINTDNAATFCRSQCNNTECTKHISKGYQHQGMCKFTLLKGAPECEGFISKRVKKIERQG